MDTRDVEELYRNALELAHGKGAYFVWLVTYPEGIQEGIDEFNAIGRGVGGRTDFGKIVSDLRALVARTNELWGSVGLELEAVATSEICAHRIIMKWCNEIIDRAERVLSVSDSQPIPSPLIEEELRKSFHGFEKRPPVSLWKARQEFAAAIIASRRHSDLKTIAARNFSSTPCPQLTDERPENGRDTHDTKPDTGKKKKKLSMTVEATDCARIYREARKRDDTAKMSQIADDYAEQHGKKASYILRVLSDNPDQWKF